MKHGIVFTQATNYAQTFKRLREYAQRGTQYTSAKVIYAYR